LARRSAAHWQLGKYVQRAESAVFGETGRLVTNSFLLKAPLHWS
jgi:hypothetical protein